MALRGVFLDDVLVVRSLRQSFSKSSLPPLPPQLLSLPSLQRVRARKRALPKTSKLSQQHLLDGYFSTVISGTGPWLCRPAVEMLTEDAYE